jgi:hypothetical protein
MTRRTRDALLVPCRPLTRLRLALAAGLLSVAATACGSPDALSTSTAEGRPPSPTPGVPAEWTPATPWERALAEVDEDGSFSTDAALALFATAYGPLPGVDIRQDLAGVVSRTIAIRAVDRHRDSLSEEQREAIDRYLKPPADAATVVVPPVAQGGSSWLATAGGIEVALAIRAASPPRTAVLADAATEQAVRDVGAMSRSVIASNLGRDFLGDHTFYVVPRPGDVEPIDGLYPNGGTRGVYEGGVFAGCQTVIYAEATAQSAVQLAALIAHETFHCFQADGYRLIEPHSAAPSWVIEGQATWVGLEVGGPSPNYDRFWKKYLVAPRIDLRTRAYDAVGFYAHLAETGINPWSIFEAQWAAGSDHFAIFEATGATGEAFLDSWASSVTRDAARGAAWDTTGEAITSDRYEPSVHAIVDGTAVDLSAAVFTNDVRSLSIDVDLLRVEVEGHVRLSDGSVDLVLHENALFCIVGHDCAKVCPGSDPPPATDGTIGSRVLVATTGSIDGSLGTASGIDLEDCESPPPSEEPDNGEFCRRYRDYVAWAESLPEDTDVTQALAAEIARRFDDMWPVAPDDLQDEVQLVWTIYATFAGIDDPYNIPATGQVGGIENLPDALMAMHAHCGIPWPGG